MPPFTYTGLDYLGPPCVQNGGHVQKCWICLFTCLTIQAIHLEVVEYMSTVPFIQCLRRFIGRRGTPCMMISDNASQLKLGYSAMQVWKDIADDSKCQNYVAERGIRWKFIVDYAPWKGGYYERLIGLSNRSLRKSLGKTRCTFSELRTLIVEVEAVLNSRPLTYVGDDIDSGHALTPGHFLSVNYKCRVPNVGPFTVNQDSSAQILRVWKKGQAHLDSFWIVWVTEYLPTLPERQVSQIKPTKGEVLRRPLVGEVVIVKEDGLPCGKWKLAKVIGMIGGEVDGIERAANLQFPPGRTAKRPLRLIYPLECDFEEAEAGSPGVGKTSFTQDAPAGEIDDELQMEVDKGKEEQKPIELLIWECEELYSLFETNYLSIWECYD